MFKVFKVNRTAKDGGPSDTAYNLIAIFFVFESKDDKIKVKIKIKIKTSSSELCDKCLSASVNHDFGAIDA